MTLNILVLQFILDSSNFWDFQLDYEVSMTMTLYDEYFSVSKYFLDVLKKNASIRKDDAKLIAKKIDMENFVIVKIFVLKTCSQICLFKLNFIGLSID